MAVSVIVAFTKSTMCVFDCSSVRIDSDRIKRKYRQSLYVRSDRMSFSAANSDHSITNVSFKVSLDRAITASAIRAVVEDHLFIAQRLPASHVDTAQRAVEFAYLRPDGSATWALRLAQGEIEIECSAYTRWAKIWERTNELFSFVEQCFLTVEFSPRVRQISLSVTDRFETQLENYNIRDLLIPSDLIAPIAFSGRPLWHSFVGWFDTIGSDKLLNQVNISAKRENIIIDADTPDRQYVVEIQHLLQYHFETDLSEYTGYWDQTGIKKMETLHQKNKNLLQSILVKSVQNDVNLTGGS